MMTTDAVVRLRRVRLSWRSRAGAAAEGEAAGGGIDFTEPDRSGQAAVMWPAGCRARAARRDLWGREGWRWPVVRTSNAYAFRDPGMTATYAPRRERPISRSRSENPTGTPNQVSKPPLLPPAVVTDSPLERVLTALGAAVISTTAACIGPTTTCKSRSRYAFGTPKRR